VNGLKWTNWGTFGRKRLVCAPVAATRDLREGLGKRTAASKLPFRSCVTNAGCSAGRLVGFPRRRRRADEPGLYPKGEARTATGRVGVERGEASAFYSCPKLDLDATSNKGILRKAPLMTLFFPGESQEHVRDQKIGLGKDLGGLLFPIDLVTTAM